MNESVLIFIIITMLFLKGDAQQTEVLTLGVFHFDFPNLDAVQISEENQIDVLVPAYQKEIELITDKLVQFKPDAVVIEQHISMQQKIDSLFKAYIAGNHELSRSEVQQIGFRIAQVCHSKIYCADA